MIVSVLESWIGMGTEFPDQETSILPVLNLRSFAHIQPFADYRHLFRVSAGKKRQGWVSSAY